MSDEQTLPSFLSDHKPVETISTEPKHMELVQAINRLDTITTMVLDILDDIRGIHPETVAAEPPEQPPSLLSLLDDGPGILNERCDNLEKCLGDIRRALFGEAA